MAGERGPGESGEPKRTSLSERLARVKALQKEAQPSPADFEHGEIPAPPDEQEVAAEQSKQSNELAEARAKLDKFKQIPLDEVPFGRERLARMQAVGMAVAPDMMSRSAEAMAAINPPARAVDGVTAPDAPAEPNVAPEALDAQDPFYFPKPSRKERIARYGRKLAGNLRNNIRAMAESIEPVLEQPDAQVVSPETEQFDVPAAPATEALPIVAERDADTSAHQAHGGEHHHDSHSGEEGHGHHDSLESPYYQEIKEELIGDGHHNKRSGGTLLNLKPDDYDKLLAQMQVNGDISEAPAAIFDDNSLDQRGFRSRGKLRDGVWRRGSYRVYEVNGHDDAAVVLFDVMHGKKRGKGYLPADRKLMATALSVVKTAKGAEAFKKNGPTAELKEAILKQRLNLFLPSQTREEAHDVPDMPVLHPDVVTEEQVQMTNDAVRARLTEANDLRAAENRERRQAAAQVKNSAEQQAVWEAWQEKQRQQAATPEEEEHKPKGEFNPVLMDTPDLEGPIDWEKIGGKKPPKTSVDDEAAMSEAPVEASTVAEGATKEAPSNDTKETSAEAPATADVRAPEVSVADEEAPEESTVRETKPDDSAETAKRDLSEVPVLPEGKEKQTWPGRPEAFGELVNRVKENDKDFGLPPNHEQYNYKQAKYLIEQAISNEELKALEGDIWRRQELHPERRMFDYNPGDHNLLGVTGKAKKIMEAFKGRRIEFADKVRKERLNEHVNKKYADELAGGSAEGNNLTPGFEKTVYGDEAEMKLANQLVGQIEAARQSEMPKAEREGIIKEALAEATREKLTIQDSGDDRSEAAKYFDKQLEAMKSEANENTGEPESERGLGDSLISRLNALGEDPDFDRDQLNDIYEEATGYGYIDEDSFDPKEKPGAETIANKYKELYYRPKSDMQSARELIDHIESAREQDDLSADERQRDIQEALAEALQLGIWGRVADGKEEAARYFEGALEELRREPVEGEVGEEADTGEPANDIDEAIKDTEEAE